MKKVRVAFFAEILIEDFDGASRTMFQIIRRIPNQQFEFLFVCGNGPSQLFGFDCFLVPSITLPVNSSYTMALPFLAETPLAQKLAEFGPDIIHIATPSPLGTFALNFARQNQLPVLTIYHTHFIAYLDYYLSKAAFLISFAKARVAAYQRNFYNFCDTIYVPSESMTIELQKIGVERNRMKIWKRGIDTLLFSPQKRNIKSVQLLTGNSRINILFASRLVWEKNLQTLIRIYDHCESKNLNYNFIIAGDGAAGDSCKQRMKNAVFTGKLTHNELAVLYASADIFLFTSVSETYGNVVLEAMASGLPCVVADGGGSADFIIQGVNGFKCQPENHTDYIEKIGALAGNQDMRRMISDNGRAYSLGFDWGKLADVYFEELENLAGILHT